MSSPDDMLAAVATSMAERTGRTLDGWVELVMASDVDPLDQKAVRAWLRDVHGVKQNTQWAIADAVATKAGWQRPSVDEYTGSQYTGAKAALRPIYDAIEELALGLGEDVRAEGRSTYVPFVRSRQFAAVQAGAKHVDLGLRFTDPPDSPRMAPAKAPGQSTHRVRLSTVDEVDGDVHALLRAAYEQNP